MSPEQISCLAEMVREEMREDWRRGRRTPLEAFLARHRELAGLANSASDRLIDLIYAEFRLASTHGQAPDLTDYARRFPQVKDRLERLFAIHAQLGAESEFPSAPSLPGQLPREPIVAALSEAPRNGSRYRPLQLHAQGGLGEVFVARDLELPREVALKEIQPRYAGQAAVRSRFVREAEITGALEHPGIVAVYGLGAYPDGRPYYAMRFIRGESLKEAIDRFHAGSKSPGEKKSGEKEPGEKSVYDDPARLAELRKLLGRFVAVCNAIAFAHSRRVIHRDLKPGNVMLGDFGETLVVDWGLAKELGEAADPAAHETDPLETLPPDTLTSEPMRPDASPLVTRPGSLIGTLAFMSPEQAAGKLDEVGPASDIFSLGATLYCLLTGKPPFTGDAVGEVKLAAEQNDFPAVRAIAPRAPKALAAICEKAMATAPSDRYASPLSIAEDIERWLADEPTSVYREGLALRARRLIKRRPALAAGTAVGIVTALTALAGALALTGAHNRELGAANGQLARANSDLGAANRELASANGKLKVANKKESTARAETERVLGYFVTAFRKADPAADGRRLTVAEMLDQAVAAAQGDSQSTTRVKTGLLQSIGKTYIGLGLYRQALATLESAERLAKADKTFDPQLMDRLQNELATARQLESGSDAALLLYEETLKKRRAELGDKHAETLTSMHNLAYSLGADEQYERSFALFEEALAGMKETLGDEHEHATTLKVNLASALRRAGRYREALALAEKTVGEAAKYHGENSMHAWRARAEQAIAIHLLGDSARAIPLLEAAIATFRASAGPDHPDTLILRGMLATAYRATGRGAEALVLAKEVWQSWRDSLGEAHPKTLSALNDLALAHATAGDVSEALRLQAEQLALAEKRFGAADAQVSISRLNLGTALGAAGKTAEAIALQQQAHAELEKSLGPSHVMTLTAMQGLAESRLSANQYPAAIALFRELLDRFGAALGEEHPQTLRAKLSLADALRSTGDIASARPLAESAARSYDLRGPSYEVSALGAWSHVATIEQSLGRLDRAIALGAAILPRYVEKLGPDHPDTLNHQSNLAWSYKLAGRPAEAEPLLRDNHRRRAALLGPDHPQTLIASGMLAGVLLELANVEESLPLFDRFIDERRAQVIAGGELRFSQTLYNAARDLLLAGQAERAEALLRECLALREKHAPTDWSKFQAKSLLGAAIGARETNDAEAATQLLAGYDGLQSFAGKLPAGRERELPLAAWRLMKHHLSRGDAEHAAHWRETLEALERARPEPPSTEREF